MKKEIAGKIYDRFCKEKEKLNREKEIEEITNIVSSSKNIAHELYVRYGVDTICNLNYNDHIKEINLILNS